MIGVALALYAAGNIYWQFALVRRRRRAVPLGGRCLLALRLSVLLRRRRAAGPRADAAPGFAAVARRHRRRADHRRVSAALVFGALQVSTGGDPAAVATNLAYPLGDMILLGQRHRRHGRRPQPPGPQLAVVRRRDRRLRRLRLHLPLQIAKEHLRRRHAARHRLARGRAAGGHRRLAARPCASAPPATSCRASSRRPCSRSASLALLVYDHFARRQPARRRPARRRARGGAHPPVADAPREPLQPGHDARARRAPTRSPGSATASPCSAPSTHALGDPAPHVLLLFDLDGFKNYNDSYGHPAGDALLTRLGSALAAATAADGSAYRVGGDEFCVLAAWPADQAPDALIERARAALCEQGDGLHDRRLRRLRDAARRRRGRRRGACASPIAVSTPRSTAGACRPGCRARACCAAR